jgi:hypothetical protein
VKLEGLVCTAQDTYEVSLEDLDRFLGNVLYVIMWRDELVFHVVAFGSFLELG